MHDADLTPLVAPGLGARVRHAFLGSAADERVAGPKLIALTFDDGPYPVDTPALLAVLREARVPATFFLIGRDAEQYPGLVARDRGRRARDRKSYRDAPRPRRPSTTPA